MRFDQSLAGDYPDLPKGLSPEARKDWIFQRFVKDHYRTMVGVDENIGRVLDYLDRKKLAQDTLVIYTTDRRVLPGRARLRGTSAFMYEPSLRLPLLLRYPRAGRAGRVGEPRFALEYRLRADHAGYRWSSLRRPPCRAAVCAPYWREAFHAIGGPRCCTPTTRTPGRWQGRERKP